MNRERDNDMDNEEVIYVAAAETVAVNLVMMIYN